MIRAQPVPILPCGHHLQRQTIRIHQAATAARHAHHVAGRALQGLQVLQGYLDGDVMEPFLILAPGKLRKRKKSTVEKW